MRLLLDQMFHLDLGALLRGEGHDVLHVAEIARSRADDSEILEIACREGRVLITRDGDFGDWAVLPLGDQCGVIRVETKPTTTAEAAAVLVPFLAASGEDQFKNCLVIVSRSRVRRIRTGA